MPRVAIVGGVRTPFVKAAGAFGRQSFLSMGTHTVTALIERLSIDPSTIDEIAYGTVLVDPRISNFAREIVLRTTLPKSIGAHSVSNNCISGLVAANFITEGIQTERIKSGICGGSESMSRPTLTFHPKAEELFYSLFRARSLGERLAVLSRFRPKLLMPQPPSPKEPSTGLTMGQHCELTAQELGIPRDVQDEIALASHKNAARAQQAGLIGTDIVPLDGVDKDNLVRPDTSIERLRKLPAVFERSSKGTLTAGNSSALTDGASAVWLMAEGEARRLGREILGYIEGIQFAAIDPKDGLLMAPCVALPKLLTRHGLSVDSVDIFEIHEAFAAQVAANLKIWERGWAKYGTAPIGKIPKEKINRWGGSIALGHPFAATGGRLIMSALRQLQKDSLNTAVISVCAAGAMAGAVLIRRQ